MDLINCVVRLYLDQFVIAFRYLYIFQEPKSHQQHLGITCQTLRRQKLYAKFGKCDFWFAFLGDRGIERRHISQSCKGRDYSKMVEAKICEESQSLLGLSGYYRQFVE